MIKVEAKEVVMQEIPVSVVCDRCGKEVIFEENDMEVQEFHRIDFTGGFSSVFGDMSEVECDICQHCLYELISKFCWIDGEKQHE